MGKPPRSFETRWARDFAEGSDRIRVVDRRLIIDHVETPYDEHGIVDKRGLLSNVLGSVASDQAWKGTFQGPHHVMWPRYAYQRVSPKSSRSAATHFRGSPSLKVILPRQLHDYLHIITEPPVMPAHDVMEQYAHEQYNVHRLYDTIRFHGAAHLSMLPRHQQDVIRWGTMLEKLDTMDDGYVGLMPNKEALANAGIVQARQVLRSIARSQGLSNDPNCQDAFFNPPTLERHQLDAA